MAVVDHHRKNCTTDHFTKPTLTDSIQDAIKHLDRHHASPRLVCVRQNWHKPAAPSSSIPTSTPSPPKSSPAVAASPANHCGGRVDCGGGGNLCTSAELQQMYMYHGKSVFNAKKSLYLQNQFSICPKFSNQKHNVVLKPRKQEVIATTPVEDAETKSETIDAIDAQVHRIGRTGRAGNTGVSTVEEHLIVDVFERAFSSSGSDVPSPPGRNRQSAGRAMARQSIGAPIFQSTTNAKVREGMGIRDSGVDARIVKKKAIRLIGMGKELGFWNRATGAVQTKAEYRELRPRPGLAT
ncbi:hypothetical protein EJ08DRAFT_662841 [Tothia fuscella]|uniref:Uncharacterized protein n=1 Tax=Tothia fuscella TaxID=1048955 RepID=A0A9P4NLV5_9PEZI|nr:hypothetical protein EJ08DRAFT_662841 [Tothia fuscella]